MKVKAINEGSTRLAGAVARLAELRRRTAAAIAARASNRTIAANTYSSAVSEANDRLDERRTALNESLRKELDDAARTRDDAVSAANANHVPELRSLRSRCDAALAALAEEAAATRQATNKAFDEATWMAQEVHESETRRATRASELAGEVAESQGRRLDSIIEGVSALMRARGATLTTDRTAATERGRADADGILAEESAEGAAPEVDIATAIGQELDEREASDSMDSADETDPLAAAEQLLLQLQQRRIATWSSPAYGLAIAVICTGIGGVTGLLWPGTLPDAGVGAGAGLGLGLLVIVGLRVLTVRNARASLHVVRQVLESAAVWIAREEHTARGRAERHQAAAERAFVVETKRAKSDHERRLARLEDKRTSRQAAIERKFGPMIDANQTALDRAVTDAETAYASRERLARQVHQAEMEQAERAHAETVSAASEQNDRQQAHIEQEWADAYADIGRRRRDITELDDQLPTWDDPAWRSWRPASTAPCGVNVRLATTTLEPASLPSSDQIGPSELPSSTVFPVSLSLPEAGSLLLRHGRDGRDSAVGILRASMLRVLAAIPPGKVRFTVIDPVGLGQSLAGFMHLADFDDKLVSGRIWTEPKHIEARLADLTEHMENVIQKFLRNEYPTIEAYNERAQEIAEPYRFLVISDFPTNFDDASVKRLRSVISSGARCGVHTLIAHDERLPLPSGLEPEDLISEGIVLEHKSDSWRFSEKGLREQPIELPEPPEERLVTSVVRLVGEAAIDTSRVEVPFEAVAPTATEMWSRTCDEELRAPLGRSGATAAQELALGRGTAQHALIAGKTGSGKSTLLHVLVTNLAMWYSPDEVEFYLVDFKKGVEFKTYATHAPPHARAVAIESDREFGLSVLRRVDAELRRRGDLFREAGVQNLAGFRAARDGFPMPRTLLIIDEFQELFVEDDTVSQDASLLLDRLVRQGRAFGIHVVLGSQTLGGAYGLARSTLNQMGVRVALQCSEADSYLILSEENAAARLLTRPGEAIYNNAAGLVEGNSPFQVVWLPDERRDAALELVSERTKQATADTRRTWPMPIVFEGNRPADLARRGGLIERCREHVIAPGSPIPLRLGEPVAIREDWSVLLERRGGANMLLVGQQIADMDGIHAAAILSAALPSAPGDALVYAIAGEPASRPMLDGLADALETDIRVLTEHEADTATADIAEEVKRRVEEGAMGEPTIILALHGGQRLRSLRRSDDGFGFSMSEDDAAPSKPDKRLADILRDGPAVGVHVTAWFDSVSNVERWLDRSSIREFEHRVLLQTNATDSTTLIDTPDAARLGPNRALYVNREAGISEKFRPYGSPRGSIKAMLADPM